MFEPSNEKMSFCSDLNKQAQEIIFSRNIDKIINPQLLFNQNLIKSSPSQKHVEMVLDIKSGFNSHLKTYKARYKKTKGRLLTPQNIVPRESLVTSYKSFTRNHLDYGKTIYDRACNTSFHQNIESMQYCAGNYGSNKRNFKRKNL